MTDLYDKEVEILGLVKENLIENIIAKIIYCNKENVCIWME
jgi:hypothetical protein